jgi:hypothetical protein
MPRYLLQTGAVAPSGSAAAVQLATRLFPEIAVEHCYVAHDEVNAQTTWVCRAPSDAHLRRWANASGFGRISLQRIDAEHSSEGHRHDP